MQRRRVRLSKPLHFGSADLAASWWRRAQPFIGFARQYPRRLRSTSCVSSASLGFFWLVFSLAIYELTLRIRVGIAALAKMVRTAPPEAGMEHLRGSQSADGRNGKGCGWCLGLLIQSILNRLNHLWRICRSLDCNAVHRRCDAGTDDCSFLRSLSRRKKRPH